MLAIGRRCSNFSLTKSGRTKSWTFSCVSRTRFRKAGERRKRRGRCTNFLTGKGYAAAQIPARLRGVPRRSEAKAGQLPLQKDVGEALVLDGVRRSVSALFLVARASRYLLIDISNSFTKLAFATGTRIERPRRIATARLTSAWVRRAREKHKIDIFVVSSVVEKSPGQQAAEEKQTLAESAAEAELASIIPNRSQSGRPIGKRRRRDGALRISCDRGGFRHRGDF